MEKVCLEGVFYYSTACYIDIYKCFGSVLYKWFVEVSTQNVCLVESRVMVSSYFVWIKYLLNAINSSGNVVITIVSSWRYLCM